MTIRHMFNSTIIKLSKVMYFSILDTVVTSNNAIT